VLLNFGVEMLLEIRMEYMHYGAEIGDERLLKW
jgi:hypothetical protein